MRAKTAFIVVSFTLVAPAGAQATFPGANGKIAYENGQDLRVINPDGSDRTTIHNDPTFDQFHDDLAWSADGRELAFDGGLGEIAVVMPTAPRGATSSTPSR